MANSGLISDIKVNLRLFREWYNLKRCELSPSQLGRTFLSLLHLPQLLPKGSLFPLIQNKLWETVHSWITFCGILGELSGQHHMGGWPAACSSFFCFEESDGQMEKIFPRSTSIPSINCSTVRAAGGFHSGTSARDGLTHPVSSLKPARTRCS